MTMPPSPRTAASLLLAGAALLLAPAMDAAHAASGGTPRQEQPPSCTTSECHADLQRSPFTHGPVAMGDCTSCHGIVEETTPYESGDDHWFDMEEEDGRLCQKCHESPVGHDSVVHAPLLRNQCLACHDAHGSDHPALVRRARSIELCVQCHEPKFEDERKVHAPVRAGACVACHDPHSSTHPLQLAAEGPQLCTRCHVDMGLEIERSVHAHQPVLEKCTNCHDPHDSANDFLLRQEPPTLCLDCHTDMAAHLAEVSVPHGAIEQPGSCLGCHDPHTTAHRRQLKDRPKELCFRCHGETIVSEKGVLRDMRTYLEENPFHHGPIREGNCAACHDPHGSSNLRMLRGTFPASFYSAFEAQDYGLCFGCHKEAFVQTAETTELTGFRNGSRNLHFVHVNRPDKGRTCRACHDVHASKRPKLLAESVPFGQWQLPLQYVGAPNGGSCSPGCHETRTYDREVAFDNPGVRR